LYLFAKSTDLTLLNKSNFIDFTSSKDNLVILLHNLRLSLLDILPSSDFGKPVFTLLSFSFT